LRACVALLEETVDTPILIGRPEVISFRCTKLGLPKNITDQFEIVNPLSDARYDDYCNSYHSVMQRRGVTPDLAKAILRTNTTVIAAVMVHRGEADSMICGTFGQYLWHLSYVEQLLSTSQLHPAGALSLMIMDSGPLFVADTQVRPEPDAAQIAQTAIASARHVRRFGIEPKVALCSNSQFGNLHSASAQCMRDAMKILDDSNCDFQFEGEMQLDSALDPELRMRVFPQSRLEGKANVMVFSASETASAVRNALKTVSGGLEVGPILMGMGNRAHIVTPSITARGLLNMAALAGTHVQQYA